MVHTPSPVSNAAMVLKKKDGSKRIVVDLRSLNRISLPDRQPLPNVADLQAFLAQGTLRYSMDLASAYWQWPLAKESVPLTATFFGADLLLSWLVSPMGLAGLPGQVQRAMAEDFDNEFTRCYIDDIVGRVGSAESTPEQDEQQLLDEVRRLLSVARKQGWTMSGKKCFLGFEQLEQLGSLISTNAIAPMPDYLASLRNYGTPSTKSELRTFTGMMASLARHIPHAASAMRTLNAAGNGTGRLLWTDEVAREFEVAKSLLTSADIVVPFDESRPIIVLTDWSVGGIGVALCHLSQDETRFEIIEVFSRANSSAERNYVTQAGELQGLRVAVKRFPHLLRQRRFYWATDASTMTTFLHGARTSDSVRIRRTSVELQDLDCHIISVPGKTHFIADALSRDPRWAAAQREVEREGGVHEPSDEPLFAVVATIGIVNAVNEAFEDDSMPEASAEEASEEIDDAEADGASSLSALHDAVPGALVARWIQQQEEDVSLNDMWKVAKGTAPRSADATVQPCLLPNGLLGVRLGDEPRVRAVVPSGCVTEVVAALHAGAGATAHAHARVLLHTARRDFYWRSMWSDVVKFVRECLVCQRMRADRRPGNLGDSEVEPPRRLEGWQLDTYELAGQSFLTGVELFSGLRVFETLKNASSAEAWRAINAMVIRSFGQPKFFQTDPGTEFAGEFEFHCVGRGIQSRLGAVANSQAQARVERSHRDFNATIAKLALLQPNVDVELLMSQAVEAHNNNAPGDSPHGLSPHELLFGSAAPTPLAAMLDLGLAGAPAGTTAAGIRRTHQLQVDTLKAIDVVREEQRRARRARHERAYANRHGAVVEYEEGELVWVDKPKSSTDRMDKLTRKQQTTGPWRVVKVHAAREVVDVVFHRLPAGVSGGAAVHSIPIRRTRRYLDPEVLDSEDAIAVPRAADGSHPYLGDAGALPPDVLARLKREAQSARGGAGQQTTRRSRLQSDYEAGEREAEQERVRAARVVLDNAAADRADYDDVVRVVEVNVGLGTAKVELIDGSTRAMRMADAEGRLVGMFADFQRRQRTQRARQRHGVGAGSGELNELNESNSNSDDDDDDDDVEDRI